MCGRYVSTMPVDAIRAIFGTRNAPTDVAPSWNVAPTDPAMVVRRHPESGERRLDMLRWGLVPSFHGGELKRARRPINARSESAATSPMFRRGLIYRRCLVPADAFYGWPDGGSYPYAIARQDRCTIAFAGIWDTWLAPDGDVLRTFAILTCPANATIRNLHERMPVILERADWPIWLGERDGNANVLMRPAASSVLIFWPVSRAVNSVRNNGPELIAAAP